MKTPASANPAFILRNERNVQTDGQKSDDGREEFVSSRLASGLVRWGLVAVCLLYFLQVWSPLRLDGDSIEILSVASSAADGHGFLENGQKTRFPPGYPFMVACMDRLHVARPWSLVGLNFAFLVLAFGSAYALARDYFSLSSTWGMATVLYTTLSFALVKHFPLTLTDIPFFGTSMASLVFIVKAEKQIAAYYRFFAAALTLAIAGVLIRPMALALFPSLAWSIGKHLGIAGILRANKKLLITLAIGVAVIVVAIGVILLRSLYVQGAVLVFVHQGIGKALRDTLRFRFEEIGELALNVPASKAHSLALVVSAGIVGAITLLMNFRLRRLGTVEVYLAAYLFIVLIWPYNDTRFWVPLLPLIAAELFSLARPYTVVGWKKRALLLYAAYFAFMGLAALAYSTRITFSGHDFPLRFGDGNLRATYELFYWQTPPNGAKIDPDALNVLKRYAGNRPY